VPIEARSPQARSPSGDEPTEERDVARALQLLVSARSAAFTRHHSYAARKRVTAQAYGSPGASPWTARERRAPRLVGARQCHAHAGKPAVPMVAQEQAEANAGDPRDARKRRNSTSQHRHSTGNDTQRPEVSTPGRTRASATHHHSRALEQSRSTSIAGKSDQAPRPHQQRPPSTRPEPNRSARAPQPCSCDGRGNGQYSNPRTRQQAATAQPNLPTGGDRTSHRHRGDNAVWPRK